jgi:hypothetical protein
MKIINWKQFDDTVGRDAYLDLDLFWRRTVEDLSEQYADPDVVYERYLLKHPTREPTAKIIKQALIWRLNGGELVEE